MTFLSAPHLQSKENRTVNERLIGLESSYTAETERMRGELNRLRGVEEEAKNKTNQVTSLLEELERLRKELSATQQEKKTIEDWAQTYRDEMEKVRLESRFYIFTFTRSCPGPPSLCAPCTGVIHGPLLICSFTDISIDVGCIFKPFLENNLEVFNFTFE